MASDEGMRLLRECHSMLKALLNNGASGGVAVADDRDLDSQYGDEIVKKDPKRWTGESYAGKRMSETCPEYLEDYASFKDWCADKDEQEAKKLEGEAAEKKSKYAHYGRKSAARARGWAARLRSGWKPPFTPTEPGATDEGWA